VNGIGFDEFRDGFNILIKSTLKRKPFSEKTIFNLKLLNSLPVYSFRKMIRYGMTNEGGKKKKKE
jgi:hypothetical protein